jgi:hypothetical protein
VAAKDPTLRRFGENVRARREALDLSQEQLAERADLDRTYISGVERRAPPAASGFSDSPLSVSWCFFPMPIHDLQSFFVRVSWVSSIEETYRETCLFFYSAAGNHRSVKAELNSSE